MTRRLEYSTESARPSEGTFERRVFAIFAALSAALFVFVCGLWVVSYHGTTPAFKPDTNNAVGAPPVPHILIPQAADYPQYWVPLNGHLERWENAGRVGGGWFRWHRGFPLWIPALMFALLPGAWAIGKWKHRKAATAKPRAAPDRGGHVE